MLFAWRAAAAVTVTGEVISLISEDAVLMFSRTNGAITAFAERGTGKSICRSTDAGLWAAQLADGALAAARFGAGNPEYRFSFAVRGATAVDLIYECPALKVVVRVAPAPGGFEFGATVTPAAQVLRSIDLPAGLLFDPQSVERVVAPALPDDSAGLALNRHFFADQSDEYPAGWSSSSVGPGAFTALYGRGIATADEKSPPVKLSVTEEGGRWLPPDLARMIGATALPVVRAQPPELCDITLVASPNGAYFSGSRLGGGGGALWRIGDGVRDERQQAVAQELVPAVVGKLIAAAPRGRERVALLDLHNGPQTGGWNSITVAQWRTLLQGVVADSDRLCRFVSLPTIAALNAELAADAALCIVNPYGEQFPARSREELSAAMTALKSFVHGGGHWIETGGYPFYQVLRPEKYLRYEAAYPPAYADFFHLQTTVGQAALYRAQPRPRGDPWQAAVQRGSIFVPGRVFCGGSESGGYIGRSFTTWVEPGEEWSAPPVRLTAGSALEPSVAAYCTANAITTPLEKKIRPETLAILKQAPLLYLAGPCAAKRAALDSLPVPALIHFADYLHGGFDKQYPDHLPPHSEFGTMAEFQELVAALRAKGHLFSPYTNPTWWCDDPKGPTFEREGSAPLLIKEDGKHRFEDYHGKSGWSVTLWHPAVQAANRRVRQQFTEDIPVDILFQDQCGARGFLYDFNPAAPTPYAYSEGMISMNDEDSRHVPLGTEHGWDRVAEFQTMLCGLTWGIVPTRGGPAWRRCLKTKLSPQTWTIYPLAQALSHDKCVFGHHDLGQFVTDNRSLVWTLALGYHLSWRGNADFMNHAASREWYAWLCRLQRTVAARYTGEPLKSFRHDRAPMLARAIDHTDFADDGVITAVYGDLAIAANLGPVERVVEGRTLAPYGFYAAAPGMTAGVLAGESGRGECAFAAEHREGRSDIWIFAGAGETLRVPVPYEGRVRLTTNGVAAGEAEAVRGAITLRIPEDAPRPPRLEPPAEIRRSAPCNWPGERPLIGVIDLGAAVQPLWTRAGAAEWIEAVRGSSLGTLHGLEVRSIASWTELQQALNEGSRRWLAIVNPYGERLPSEKEGGWRATQDALRKYVENGGAWWETGGYPFHSEVFNDGSGWKSAPIGPQGAERMGMQVASDAIEARPVALSVTRAGEHWMGKPAAERLNRRYARVNRALLLPGGVAVTPLLASESGVYAGGYRLGGWGHLWRIGGMHPEPALAASVMIAATLHQYTNPPEPVRFTAAPRLRHFAVSFNRGCAAGLKVGS